MSRGIAYRRAKMATIKQQRRHWWQHDMSPQQIGLAAATPKPCSCWMCGHARRHHGRTMQERRQLDSFEIQKDDGP
ncbi:hypothetical protein [Paludibacterium sp. B53371]|uniref:hypothetical protein n=1 Tax=Paludibacterium sp. B53371 TaxID=2806263 RepID=UPI001C055869|nr:hypothetical protein [Paludibacterium sp. B53371]